MWLHVLQHTLKFFERAPEAPQQCPDCQEFGTFEENHMMINTALVRLQSDVLQLDSKNEQTRNGTILAMLRGDDQTAVNLLGMLISVRGHIEWRENKDGSYEPIVVADKVKYNERSWR
jgi:hypothetical protein